jgi:glycosyltransferase involved in cell wall biosynthesis
MVPDVVVIIPALNEEPSIQKVIHDIPEDLVSEIVVVDNNSTDRTAVKAAETGVSVIKESIRGYGSACHSGLEYLKSKSWQPNVVVFLDGDYSDYPEDMKKLLEPITDRGYDLVLGARIVDKKEKRAMSFQQILGNRLLILIIRLLYRHKYRDLGPFRAIKYTKLIELDIKDRSYGWTTEMQLKALKHNLKILEIPVNYRARIGESKISGSFFNSLKAGFIILMTIFRCL